MDYLALAKPLKVIVVKSFRLKQNLGIEKGERPYDDK